jgi:hypothetical protein
MDVLLKVLFLILLLNNTYSEEKNNHNYTNFENIASISKGNKKIILKEEDNISMQDISKSCLLLYSQIQDFALKTFHATNIKISDMNNEVSKILNKYDLNNDENKIELKISEIETIISNIQKILKIIEDFSRYNFGEIVVSPIFSFKSKKETFLRLNLITTKFNSFIMEKERSQGIISELINSSGALINVSVSICSLVQKININLSKGFYSKFYKKNKKKEQLKIQKISEKLFEIMKSLQIVSRIISSLDCVNDSNAPLILKESFNQCINSLSILNILIENNFENLPKKNEIEIESKKILKIILKKCTNTGSLLQKITELRGFINILGKKEENAAIPKVKFLYRYLYLKLKSPFSNSKIGSGIWDNFLANPKAIITTYFGLGIYFYLKDFNNSYLSSFLHSSGDILCSLYETIYAGTIGIFKGSETLISKNNIIQMARAQFEAIDTTAHHNAQEKFQRAKLACFNYHDSNSSKYIQKLKEKYSYVVNINNPDADGNSIESILTQYFYEQNLINYTTNSQKEIIKIMEEADKTLRDINTNKTKYEEDYNKDILGKSSSQIKEINKNYTNKIESLFNEELKQKLIPLMTSHGLKDLINTYSDFKYPSLGNLGRILSSLAMSILSVASIAKIDSESKILPSISSGFTSFHDWMLGKDSDLSIKQSNMEPDSIHSEITINSEAFKSLADRNDLDWFYQVIDRIKNPYSFNDTNFPRAIMIEGPSGSGKTFFTKAFAQTISNLKNEISELKEVMFIEVEPKHVYIDEKNSSMFFDYLSQQIEENRLTTNVIILYLDEFHLFFTDKSGHLSSEKVANFLKLFSDLKQKQKNTPGGVYMVVSTNKSEFIPYEIMENPDRIANVIRIDYPTYFERISIISNYLKKTGNQSDNIDLNYISSVLEGLKVSQGKLIKIIDLALAKSRMRHKIINTAVVYESINELGRRILYDKNPIHPRILNSLALYYAAKASLSVNFNAERIEQFDAATLYPVKIKRIPKSLKDMFQKSNNHKLVYGTAFYSNMANNIPLLSLRETVINILKELAGKVYCKINNIDIAMQSIDDSKKAYQNTYKYFSLDNYDALNEIQGAKVKFSKDGNKKQNFYTNQKVKDISHKIMHMCESYLEEFFKKEAVIKMIFDVSNLLKENKIININNIKELDSYKNNIEKTKELFEEMVNNIIKDFSKN